MERDKLLLVIHKSSPEQYDVCLKSLSQLNKVPGFAYEVIYWEDDGEDGTGMGNIGAIYNSLREQSRNSYKIFFSDNVSFVNEDILNNVVAIFQADEKISVIGVQGTDRLPADGNIAEADISYGGCYWLDNEGNISEDSLTGIEVEYKEVEAVTSTFVAVRDQFACKEGIEAAYFGELLSLLARLYGYKAVVPRMPVPWCLVEKNEALRGPDLTKLAYEKSIIDILMTVDKPLLTIGIPTYNRSKYLKKCLENIYSHIGDIKAVEVLVSSNASTDDTEEVVKPYFKYANFKYYKQPENIFDRNFNYIYEHGQGSFVTACGDDDYYRAETILRILETICLYPSVAIIGVAWWGAHRTEYGKGMSAFLLRNLAICKDISSIVFNTKYYSMVTDKRKFSHTQMNQVYLELAVMRQHPEFAYIHGHNFKEGSGDHGYHPDKIIPWEERHNYGEIFVQQYYDIIHYFIGKGLTYDAVRADKESNLEHIMLRLQSLAEHGEKFNYRVDENIEEIMERNFGEIKGFEEARKKLGSLKHNRHR